MKNCFEIFKIFVASTAAADRSRSMGLVTKGNSTKVKRNIIGLNSNQFFHKFRSFTYKFCDSEVKRCNKSVSFNLD